MKTQNFCSFIYPSIANALRKETEEKQTIFLLIIKMTVLRYSPKGIDIEDVVLVQYCRSWKVGHYEFQGVPSPITSKLNNGIGFPYDI